MNKVKLTGVFMGVEFSHETHKEKFYTGTISTKRHSGNDDIIPIMVSERLLDKMVSEGQRISIDGEYRSYNKIDNGKSKCMLFVFVKSKTYLLYYGPNHIKLSIIEYVENI